MKQLNRLNKCVQDLRQNINIQQNEYMISCFFKPIIINKIRNKFGNISKQNNFTYEDWQDQYNSLLYQIIKTCHNKQIQIEGLLSYCKSIRWGGRVPNKVKFNKQMYQLQVVNEDSQYNTFPPSKMLMAKSQIDKDLYKSQISSYFKGQYKILVQLMMQGQNNYNIMKIMKIGHQRLCKMKGEIRPKIMDIINNLK